MPGQKILIIEDDPDIVELVKYNLEREGFAVLTADDGERGLSRTVTDRPDLVLLDLMLPGIEGLNVCRVLKQEPATRSIPLIMLTAKGEEADVVLGLGLGADDYVTKPFSPRELVARIRAVLRRGPCKEGERPPERVEAGPLVIDSSRHEAWVERRPLTLTLAEFRLLHALVANRGRVLTRNQLLDRMTGGEAIIIDRNVDVHVRAIRKKLGAHGKLIVTVRGIGYKCAD